MNRDWQFQSADGTISTVKRDRDGNIYQIDNQQDVTSALKASEIVRNSGENDKFASNMRQIAYIPNLVYFELYKKLGPHRENWKAWKREIQTNYPYLLTTNRKII